MRGPPSPLYGPGKVGGYTNFVPKSARASTGKYLEHPTGKVVLTAGSYDKKAGSAEVGGPFKMFGRTGGYFVYDPDQEPVTWTAAERARGQYWGVKTVESFHTYGTPDVAHEKEAVYP